MLAGKVAEARRIAQTALGQHPDDPRVWHLLSLLHARESRLANALEDIRRAVELSPSSPAFRLQEGQYLIASGRRRDALALADALAKMHLGRADWNDALGTLFTLCDEPARALVFFERAVAQATHDSRYQYNLAAVQRMIGDVTAATRTLDRVIALDPSNAFAYYTRADLSVQTKSNNHIEQMTAALDKHIRPIGDKILMNFAIAKELDDIGQYASAFNYFRTANDAQRSLYKYNVQHDIATIDEIIRVYDEAALTGARGYETNEPIFVMGLPRSGTTLVERILASHSAVYGAGELQAFPLAVVKAARGIAGRNVAKQELAQWTLKIDAQQLGRAYIESTRPQTGRTAYFSDKQPSNYLYVGLIRRALPHARLIVITRDPMDSCFAMYRSLFTGAYPFSYRLDELAAYYRAWHRLIRHWKSVLQDELLIVRYEDLVVDLESTARRMLAHCGLEWQSGCLSFHSRTDAVTTASATQVRRPIYDTSIGKWRNYRDYLQSLETSLDALQRSYERGFT